MAKPAVQSFGKYQILERIATGGMAEIYRAKLEGIGGFQRTFAIKRILPNLSQNEEYITMLVDEAKVAGLLSHANIVQILDLGQVDGVWYIAMEYVDGHDLGKVLRSTAKKGLCLPVPHSVFVTIELLKGLEYAHQRQVMRGGRAVPLNIIHRDVSPPNILLSFQGEVKLTDFGIARASLKVMETVTGIVKGRFDYMSPEQAAGRKDLDQRSDLFSVGVVLYEMLSGRHPFRTENEIATADRIRTGRYEPITKANPEVPLSLESIVDGALQADRKDRYPSATAFKEALDKFFHESGFIFNQATLAAYVRDLFPLDARTSAKPPSSSKQSHEPRTDDDIQLDTLDSDDSDYPTRLVDKSVVEKEAGSASSFGLRNPSELPSSSPFTTEPIPLDVLSADEQETLIKKDSQVAREWEEDPETVVAKDKGAAAEWADEQETVLRKSPFEDRPPVQPPAEPSPGPAPAGRPRPGLMDSIPPVAPRPPRVRGTAVGWLGWLMTVVALGVGLVSGGVLAGSVSALLLGGQPDAPAVLQVVAPPRTAVTVDGDAVSKRIELTSGAPHQVQVVLPGRPPWSDTITLAPGETHVLNFIVDGDGSQ